jgi:4-hydroxy-tetrahydrodipicolinate reductase
MSMKVAIIGYGKMGHEIEGILKERNHLISAIINIDNIEEIHQLNADNTDVAIEFTAPEAAYKNITTLLDKGVKTISGSTGWLDKIQDVETFVKENKGSFFYASNYSLGVNITFRLNEILAKMMEGKGYNPKLEEIHHIHKLDSPSGTALTLASGIINNNNAIEDWQEKEQVEKNILPITSFRKGEVPGTHTVIYNSAEDSIELKHTAHSRRGFALGAVMVAEWIQNKSGFLSMDDYFDFSL